MVWTVSATALLIALLAGLRLRQWTFDATAPIRFQADISRGFRYGSLAHEVGLLNVYDDVAQDHVQDENYELDYAPLRLTAMYLWVAAIPNSLKDNQWHPDYGFHAPVLYFNTTMELLAALAVFLLAREWARRCDLRGPQIRAAMGALLLWFSPAVILSAHGWPTWDVWVVPFYVLAVWLACIDWWFAAGVVVAIGAMFKGQQLFVAPIFIIWPFIAARPTRAAAWAAGFISAFALIAAPWLLTMKIDPAAQTRILHPLVLIWLVGLLLACIAIPFAGRRLRWPWWANLIAGTALFSALFLWPLFLNSEANTGLLASIALVSGMLLSIVPQCAVTRTAAAIIGCSILSTIGIFGASRTWLDIGFGYGTYHHASEMMAGLSSNLAAILYIRFGWHETDDLLFSIGNLDITVRAFLILLYMTTTLLCCIGAGMHFRRRDPRFLIAITAPWLMLFTFLPQIHERYLLYAATIGCVLVSAGFGMSLLNLFLVAVTMAMTLHVMIRGATEHGWGDVDSLGGARYPELGTQLHRFLDKTYPDVGYAVILCALLFLYLSLMPSRPRSSAG